MTADGKEMVLGTDYTFCGSLGNDINDIAKFYDEVITTTDKDGGNTK